MKKKLKCMLQVIIFVTCLFATMIFFVEISKNTLKDGFVNKNHDTDKIKTMYSYQTSEEDFSKWDTYLEETLINYIEDSYDSNLSNLTDYEKAVGAAEWVISYVEEYDSTETYKYDYDVLSSKKADCVGYSSLYNKCLDILNIPCEIISMKANITEENFDKLNLIEAFKALNIGHAVNMVTIDDNNYLVDCCFYDARPIASFLLFGKDYLNEFYMNSERTDIQHVNGYQITPDNYEKLAETFYY